MVDLADLADNELAEAAFAQPGYDAAGSFGNLLLSNVYETSIDKLNDKQLHVREIGLVSVPRENIESIKTDKKTYKSIFGVEGSN